MTDLLRAAAEIHDKDYTWRDIPMEATSEVMQKWDSADMKSAMRALMTVPTFPLARSGEQDVLLMIGPGEYIAVHAGAKRCLKARIDDPVKAVMVYHGICKPEGQWPCEDGAQRNAMFITEQDILDYITDTPVYDGGDPGMSGF